MPVRDGGKPLRAIDLCCGAGGLSAGFRAANFEIGYALDQDKDAVDTYRANHDGVEAECISITDRSPEEISELAGGAVDVVVGGPSCQTFSTAGRKNGWVRKGDPRNDLWRQMLAIVEHLRPRAFLLENVPGMMYWKRGEFGATVLDEFEKLGYSVSKKILLAADYGVPQRRRRLFLVGLLGESEFQFPEPTHLGGWRRDYLDLWEKRRKELGLLRHIQTWEAIGDLPATSRNGIVSAEPDPGRLTPFSRRMRNRRRKGEISGHATFPISADNLELIRYVPQGGTWRDIPRHLLPDRYRGMRRTDSTNLFGRLAPNLPAYTITTQFNNVTTGCFTHPYYDRSLTAREASRLQTFLDSYEFQGNPVFGLPPDRKRRPTTARACPCVGDRRGCPREGGSEDASCASDSRQARSGAAGSSPNRPKDAPTNDSPEAARARAGDPLEGGCRFPSPAAGDFRTRLLLARMPGARQTDQIDTKWWADKIEANRNRDQETAEALRAAGWRVERVWEHEAPEDAAERIAALVSELRSAVADAA